MASFEIDGVAYKSKAFDGALQLKMMLRLAPVFTAVGQMIEELTALTPAAELAPSDDEQEAVAIQSALTVKRLSEIVMPVSRELAALADKDVDFIVNACMNVTEWRLPTGQWRPVREIDGIVAHTGNDRFIVRLKITWAVIGENFSEMFAGFGVDLKGLMAKAVAK